MMCFVSGIRCSSSAPVSGSFRIKLRLPRTVPPSSTMPSIFAISAASFGRRASNNSATRGKPPVMSLVFATFRGVFASNAPVRTCWNRITGEHFLLVVDDNYLRMQIFFVLDDDRTHEAGCFIHIALDGDA